MLLRDQEGHENKMNHRIFKRFFCLSGSINEPMELFDNFIPIKRLG
jgi:hypothetical protein